MEGFGFAIPARIVEFVYRSLLQAMTRNSPARRR
jgi:hypothetical protein